jgi:vacuolar-type H+-ATPase subunit D/Vma8
MNDRIAKGMIEKMTVTSTKPTYTSLKRKEEELLAQLKDLREEIANVENGIVEEKLNTALQCLADVDEMTSGYYRCTIETYCEGCEENIEIDIDLAEIISALQQLR